MPLDSLIPEAADFATLFDKAEFRFSPMMLLPIRLRFYAMLLRLYFAMQDTLISMFHYSFRQLFSSSCAALLFIAAPD